MTRARRGLSIAGALALGLVLPFLVAQTGPSGGLPSKPRFASIGVNTAASATAGTVTALANTNAVHSGVSVDNDSNGTTNAERITMASGDASAAIYVAGSGRTSALITNGPTGNQLTVRTLGATPITFGTNNTLAATISSAQVVDFVNTPTVAGVAMPAEVNGTFTASFATACNTTPTVDFKYTKHGSVVTLMATQGMSCTSDSNTTAIDAGTLPAAIRPATNICVGGIIAGVDNSVNGYAAVRLHTDGGANFAKAPAGSTTACSSTGWTTSGTKGLGPWTASYTIN